MDEESQRQFALKRRLRARRRVARYAQERSLAALGMTPRTQRKRADRGEQVARGQASPPGVATMRPYNIL